MDLTKKLKEIKSQHQSLLKKYEEIVKEADESLALSENEKLKKELEINNKKLNELNKKIKKTLDENKDLKISLNEQIIDERLNIIKLSKDKIDLYFKKEKESKLNILEALKVKSKNQINKISNYLNENIMTEEKELSEGINKLNILLDKKIKEQREKILEQEKQFYKDFDKNIDEISKEKLDEQTIKKRIKQNKIEMKIGLNWLNRIGILLIIIAVGFFAYYNRGNIPDEVKGSLFFMLGIVFLIGGEIFYRKKIIVFAKGLLGGGIGVLYSSVFFSYFTLEILSMNAALLVAVIVTLTAIVLALRYNSKTIISVGLIGGYLPFIAYLIAEGGFQGELFYYAMGYLFILNLFIIIISFYKNWVVSNYISFVLNIPALIYLVFWCPKEVIGLIYACLTFTMYLFITLAYPLKNKKGLKALDIILLGLNTFLSTLIIYLLLDKMKLSGYHGYLALGFCLLYAGLGYFINKVIKQDKSSVYLFYLTALTFAVLMVPFQFEMAWATIGWLVEGVLLTIFGYLKKEKWIERAGWIIFGICLIIFYYYEMLIKLTNVESFDLKYTFIIAGMLLSYIIYQIGVARNKTPELSVRGKFIKYLKYFTILNLYFFLNYITQKYFREFILDNMNISYDVFEFYSLIIFTTITIGLGFIISNIKYIYDTVIKVASIVLYILGDLVIITMLLVMPVLDLGGYDSNLIKYLTLAVLVIYNLIILLNIRYLIISLLKKSTVSFEHYPLWFGIILFGNITAFILIQTNLQNVSLIISFVYLFLALTFISYGFYKRYIYIRFLGLSLIFFTLLKTLIFDILMRPRFLDITGKIIAFFGFGVLLLVISFIYQVINKKIEGKYGEKIDERK